MGWRRVLGGLVALVAVVVVWNAAQGQCWSARLWYGVMLSECPAGKMRPYVELWANGLRRGSPGRIEVTPWAIYTEGRSHQAQRTPIHRGTAKLFLVTATATTVLTPKDGWSRDGRGVLVGQVTLPPDLPDGDHRLVATMDTPLGEARTPLTLPVYAPARVLVMTDRPLYESGNLVQFRAVVLRARDLSPLDGRPGTWWVQAPDGTRVLEESAPAGSFGVAQGDFPLDATAATGDWTVVWRSGDDEGRATFRVEPFELPRFTIEAMPGRSHYGPAATPVVQGVVRYASGAPVANASVDLSWRVDGAWPPPTEWMNGGLPTRAVADGQGRFEVRLPRVPADLMGQARLRAAIGATDSAGDRVTGGVSVLLSKDDIQVTTVTELADGLVEGFNNRLYLRATTAAGSVLASAKLKVTRAWDPADTGETVTTDADGVAALQIDPGPAVTVVAPSMPVRPPPRAQPVARTTLRDHLRDAGPTIADQTTFDRAALTPCARLTTDEPVVRSQLWVAASGQVEEVHSDEGLLATCVAERLQRLVFTSGSPRLFEVRHRFNWDGPTVDLDFAGPSEPPDGWQTFMNNVGVQARSCLPDDVTDRVVGRLVVWSLDRQGKIRLRTVAEPRSGARQPPAVTDCLIRTLMAGQKWTRSDRDEQDDDEPKLRMGTIRVTVAPAQRRSTRRQERRTYLGYELNVTAFASGGDERLGATKVRLRPGRIPPLRLRTTPVVAQAGGEVEVKVLRGPDFQGTLPKKLVLVNEGHRVEAPLDADSRVARFALPKDRTGWYEVRLQSARAAVFVPDLRTLDVALSSDKPRYKPGEQARLSVQTSVAGAGTAAMVGLFGVDQTLAQLTPLPGPDVWSGLLAVPTMSSSAFGALDAVALASGRIRGPAALAATVLRVTQVPPASALDRSVSARTELDFDPVVPLTDAFYTLLSRLTDRVRRWNEDAPKEELMKPATMVRLWTEVLDDAPAETQYDAFGRRLTLDILPDDLLALLDPRVVVANGTRLPEDVDNWVRWVRRNL